MIREVGIKINTPREEGANQMQAVGRVVGDGWQRQRPEVSGTDGGRRSRGRIAVVVAGRVGDGWLRRRRPELSGADGSRRRQGWMVAVAGVSGTDGGSGWRRKQWWGRQGCWLEVPAMKVQGDGKVTAQP